MYTFFPQGMYIPADPWYSLHMTTQTNFFSPGLDRLANVDTDKLEDTVDATNILIGTVGVLVLFRKARKAAKAEQWDQALYYAVVFAAGQAGLRFRITQAEKKRDKRAALKTANRRAGLA